MATWDEVVERFRMFDQYNSLRPMMEQMLGLVGRLREEPRVQPYDRWVSHITLHLRGADRWVAVAWSWPNGMVWAGAQGFAVSRVEEGCWRDTVVVDEDEVVAAVVQRIDNS